MTLVDFALGLEAGIACEVSEALGATEENVWRRGLGQKDKEDD